MTMSTSLEKLPWNQINESFRGMEHWNIIGSNKTPQHLGCLVKLDTTRAS